MTDDLRDLLPLYALGILDARERAIVDRAAAADPAIAAELASFCDAAAAMIAEPSPVEPPADIRAQLLASSGGGRFAEHVARMASLFDVPVDRAHELLGLIERARAWLPLMPSIDLVHFEGGPHTAGADCGFIRLQPGCVFPHHKHRGEEVTFVLAGTVRDRMTGRVHGPGEEITHAIGTEHELACEGQEAAVLASRVYDGIEIGGERARPNRG